MSTKPKKKKSNKSSKKPIRILIKCSWSGGRLTPPTTENPVTIQTTLFSIINSIRDQIPSLIWEGESTVLHMRGRPVPRSEWNEVTLAMVGVEESMGSALLTLSLPGEVGGGGGGVGGASSAAAVASTTAAPAAASSSSVAEPMDIEPTTPTAPSLETTPGQAIEVILSSNFDTDSKECLVTLMKLLDNIIVKPGDEKVRNIRLGNPAFERKVVRRKGGVEFLLACGFTPKPTSQPLLSTDPNPQPEMIELLPHNESTSTILNARKLLATKAVNGLGMDMSELPKMKQPPTLTTPSDHAAGRRSNHGEFNPYKTHSYNTQSAAVGAPNPHSVIPSDEPYVSHTEKQLKQLKSKQERLESKMHKLEDRELVATKPAVVGRIVTLNTGEGEEDFGSGGGGGGRGSSGRGDGALLAGQMKKMEEERKKREEGGFTTKAMRDLEKMKKSKVYSHTQLRINFSDGASITAKFLPNEKVSEVKAVILSAFVSDMTSRLNFDLYVAPPRRILSDTKSLKDEGLVPAAKIHVSWKVGGTPPQGCPVGGFIRNELFQGGGAASSGGGAAAAAAVQYPDAQSVHEDGSASKKRAASSGGGGGKSDDGGSSREEEMMRRMMGQKPKGLLGKLGKGKGSKGNGSVDGGGDGGSKKSGGGKPKWFKG